MKIEDQVCSLELAIKLKELGIKQDSQFYYANVKSIGDHVFENEISFITHISQITEISENLHSAFTAPEIIDILPNLIDINKNEPFNNFRFNMHMVRIAGNNEKGTMIFIKNYSVNYLCDTFEMGDAIQFPRQLFEHNIFDKNLANCLGKVLLICIENRYVKA